MYVFKCGYVYGYGYMCACVCVCVCAREDMGIKVKVNTIYTAIFFNTTNYSVLGRVLCTQ